jgi:hypothetical protein
MVTSGPGPARGRSAGALAHPVDDLAEYATAIFLAMESCRALADEETAARLSAAMVALDDIARFGHVLSPDEQHDFLDDLRECDEMVTAIREHLALGYAPD